MNCAREGCKNKATSQLGVNVWAHGMAKTSPPLEMYIGLALCDDHKPDIVAKDFFPPDTIARINQALSDAGRREADFDSAEIVFHDIIDDKLITPGENENG